MQKQSVANKRLVYEFLSQVESFRQSPTSLREYFADDVVWRGCAPFDTQEDADAVWQTFWAPLFASFSKLQRRIDILLGGTCEAEHWVACTGYFIGRFEREWLNIPPTGQETCIRYGEFYQIDDGRISKVYALYDLIEVMQQAGCGPLPASLGLAGFVPAPRTADGVLLEAQSDAESKTTFELAHNMLFQGLNDYDQSDKNSMKQAQFWHDNMHWYGPAGIGATRDLDEFEQNHQLPWLRAFPDRQVVWESPMFADGLYAATAGWREVVATHSGEYLGHPPTNKHIEFRVMDFFRREGDLLTENWVLIDLIDTFRQFGVDLFAKLPPGTGRS